MLDEDDKSELIHIIDVYLKSIPTLVDTFRSSIIDGHRHIVSLESFILGHYYATVNQAFLIYCFEKYGKGYKRELDEKKQMEIGEVMFGRMIQVKEAVASVVD